VKPIYDINVFTLSTKAYEMLLSSRPYKTVVRECRCYEQKCRGRFLVKTTSTMTVCPNEAKRLLLIKTIDEYYN
jgi:hypothetical protein